MEGAAEDGRSCRGWKELWRMEKLQRMEGAGDKGRVY